VTVIARPILTNLERLILATARITQRRYELHRSVFARSIQTEKRLSVLVTVETIVIRSRGVMPVTAKIILKRSARRHVVAAHARRELPSARWMRLQSMSEMDIYASTVERLTT